MIEFYELLKKKEKYIIGLMSGTSVDGIDTAVVEITGHGLETAVNLIAFETFPFPPDVPPRILALCQPDTSRVDDICEMNFYIGHLFAEAVKHILQKIKYASATLASSVHTAKRFTTFPGTRTPIVKIPDIRRHCRLANLPSSHTRPVSRLSLTFG